MYRSILVTLDGSPFSEYALPFAVSLAHRSGATLHLARVHAATIPMFAEGVVLDNPRSSESWASERAYLEALAEQLADDQFAVQAALLDDPIDEALINHARAIRADLIVMTTHGRGGLSRLWLGSVADRLVRYSPVPVLLVRPQDAAPDLEHEPTFKHLLIPLDDSALAEQILPHALALGTTMESEYTLLQIGDLTLSAQGDELYGSPFDEPVKARVRAQAQRHLDRLAAPLLAEGMKVRTAVVFGWPAQDILTYARDHAVDAIALATHGRHGMARLLIGSVADKVVRGATVPVLLYRPRQG